ncbi:MAG: hypothetical protein AAGK02_00830 [Pseudomonadota bacterium]
MDDQDFRDITQAALNRAREEDRVDLHHAMDGIQAGRSGRHEMAAAPQSTEQDRKREDAVQAFLRTLEAIIRDGELNNLVAETVFAAKSDAEIADIVLRIERETGQSLTDYAATILGHTAAQRKPGESDADYNRRMIMAVAGEIIDPHTGQIKPQYASDPLAQIILSDTAYQKIMVEVEQVNRSGPGADSDAVVAQHRDAGYESSELSGHYVEDAGYKNELRGGQKGHRDTDLSDGRAETESETFFGAKNAMKDVSRAARRSFNTVVRADPGPGADPTEVSSAPLPGRKA